MCSFNTNCRHSEHISEIFLKCVHQNFKRRLEKILKMMHVYPPWTYHWRYYRKSSFYALWTYNNYNKNDEKQSSYIGLVSLCQVATVASIFSTDPGLIQLLYNFKAKLRIVFNDNIFTMVKGTATHSMVQVSHQEWFTYGRFKSTDMRDDLLIGSHLLLELNYTLHVNSLNYLECLLVSKLVNSSKFTRNNRMFSHNRISRGSIFSIVTDDFKKSTLTTTHLPWSIMFYFCALRCIDVDKISLWTVRRRMNVYLLRHVQVVCLSTSLLIAVALHRCDNNFSEASGNVLDGVDNYSTRGGFPNICANGGGVAVVCNVA